MDDTVRAAHELIRVQLGTETPAQDHMLSVVMDKDGRAQAVLRDFRGNVVANTVAVHLSDLDVDKDD